MNYLEFLLCTMMNPEIGERFDIPDLKNYYLYLFKLLQLTCKDQNVTFPANVSAKAFYQTSDIRKKDIKSELSLDKCYDLIDKCSTVIYTLKDDNKEQIGMIAQEVKEFVPEIVNEDVDGYLSLDYSRLTVILIRVIKDLIDKVKNYGNRN